MILMYHHVCPAECVPREHAPLEGWQYCLSPQQFLLQLTTLQLRGWQFVSLQNYCARLAQPISSRARLACVTFDDGWADNFEFAVPVLSRLGIPAVIFVVSGEMSGVPQHRRMTVPQLLSLRQHGITVGAHSSTHAVLPRLSAASLQSQVADCRHRLQDLTGEGIEFFAYPGGRFNLPVVEAVQQAGFQAACSVIGMAVNSPHSRFWLYRDVFSDGMDQFSDHLRSTFWCRRLLGWRAKLRVARRLQDTSPQSCD